MDLDHLSLLEHLVRANYADERQLLLVILIVVASCLRSILVLGRHEQRRRDDRVGERLDGRRKTLGRSARLCRVVRVHDELCLVVRVAVLRLVGVLIRARAHLLILVLILIAPRALLLLFRIRAVVVILSVVIVVRVLIGPSDSRRRRETLVIFAAAALLRAQLVGALLLLLLRRDVFIDRHGRADDSLGTCVAEKLCVLIDATFAVQCGARA